ncbi:uncharacterized protein LOC107360992 [Tetranychus urticae]|uniref:uncharacterized protein LOC107360992 n=1 Tax=Tetranychus urticae TaxID=32264 RepID=UPI00077BDB08|nr:uncharacterized protein LOC107360992 [Tetranychus urticae]
MSLFAFFNYFKFADHDPEEDHKGASQSTIPSSFSQTVQNKPFGSQAPSISNSGPTLVPSVHPNCDGPGFSDTSNSTIQISNLPQLRSEPNQRLRVQVKCNELPWKTKSWGYDPSGRRHLVIDFGQYRIYNDELDVNHEDQIPWEQLQRYTPLLRDEEEVSASPPVVDAQCPNPIHFRCVYCKATCKKMKNLKEHVIGKKYPNKKAWYIPCKIRIRDEQIPNDGFVPKGTYPPLKFPWCKLDYVDCDNEKGQKGSTIPESILEKLNAYHKDLRPGVSHSVSATAPFSSASQSS